MSICKINKTLSNQETATNGCEEGYNDGRDLTKSKLSTAIIYAASLSKVFQLFFNDSASNCTMFHLNPLHIAVTYMTGQVSLHYPTTDGFIGTFTFLRHR